MDVPRPDPGVSEQLSISATVDELRRELARIAAQRDRYREDLDAHRDEQLSALTTRLKYATDRINEVARKVHRLPGLLLTESQAMQQLLNRFSPQATLPAVGGWALSPTGLIALADLVDTSKANLAVECGSGTSTLWLAYAMRKQGVGKVIALDHLPEFAEHTRFMIRAHGLDDFAEVIDAPLVERITPRGEFKWYDFNPQQLPGPIQLLLVDGPPGNTCRHARYPALPAFSRHLAAGAHILIDDVDRRDEQDMLDHWLLEDSRLKRLRSPGAGLDLLSFDVPTPAPCTIARMNPQDGPASRPWQTSEKVVDAWLFALENLITVRSPMTGRLFQRLAERTDYTANQRARLDRLGPWAERIASPAPEPDLEPDEVPFGLMNYGTADFTQASRNLGDWIQTLSMTSHIVRRPDVKLTGDPELVTVLEDLRRRVPPESTVLGPDGTLRLVEVNRDASDYDTVPSGTWSLISGWFMKTPFGKEPPFPLNERIRPIFVSFHISRADFLQPKVIKYLSEYGPIGCRDWHTARLLTRAGVPAYFSGCATTTVGSLFPHHVQDPKKPAAYVDATPPDGATNYVTLTNTDDSLRNGPLAHGLRTAADRLEMYRTEFSEIVTSRLQTLLPAWSLGVPVEWHPKRPNDPRFDGLVGPKADSREQMASRISEIAWVVLNAILDKKSEQDVYKLYREEVAQDVEATAARLATGPSQEPPATSPDLR